MTAPTDQRDRFIAAVRRDLYGPYGVDDIGWPAAEVKVLPAGFEAPDWRALRGVLVDDEGNELLTRSPMYRYGIGVLFPTLTRRQEAQLDEAQADGGAVPTDDELAVAGPDLFEPDPEPDAGTESGGGGHADVTDADQADDATAEDRPHRPRTMGVSFLVPGATTTVTVTVTGGRYIPREVPVTGHEPARLWRRQAVELTSTVDVIRSSHTIHTIGGMVLHVGVTARPHPQGYLLTVWLVNRSIAGAGAAGATPSTLFQSQLTITGPAGTVLPYPTREATLAEDLSLELLYHRHTVRAVGHGCNAAFDSDGTTDTITGGHFPVEVVRSPIPQAFDDAGHPLVVDMDALGRGDPDAHATVDATLAGYRAWIALRRADLVGLPAHLHATAAEHLVACERFASAAETGWAAAQSDPAVGEVLAWTSTAMAAQRRAYSADTRTATYAGGRVSVAGPDPHTSTTPARWRAFQIMFVLSHLEAIAAGAAPGPVDIIWMPTGGGKTEAYLAVAAVTMLHTRRAQVAGGAAASKGTTVLMRYTLRLLTAQQLERAASLICALEHLRVQYPAKLGDKPRHQFSIGAWLGQKSTPNSRKSAVRALNAWTKDPSERSFLLTRCPWCAAPMGRRAPAGATTIDGYQVQATSVGSRVQAYCPNPACMFSLDHGIGSRPSGLPVFEVDEDIYAQPPTFVVGTVDKFAMLTWKDEPSVLFGLKGGRRVGPAPRLFIQDELHLISGPLGSLDALYEAVLEDLCGRDGGARPHIVAATATTRRYQAQAEALYGRDARLVPPPGLDATDNFFSQVDSTTAGKVFVPVFAPGFGRFQEAQGRLLAAAGAAAGSLDADGVQADPWWTNLCFFSSRRALGIAVSLCQTHLRGHSWRLFTATDVPAGRPGPTGTRRAMRNLIRRRELTAQATSDVTDAMAELSRRLDGAAPPVDVCLATSMIEVGVDIDRLGLMTIFGQPKSASQYIQVAGRVGRDETNAPGVVFVLLSPFNARDRSHFEQFSTFHRRLYAAVEPVSVTPFTAATLERGLGGALVASLRQTGIPNPSAARGALAAAYAPVQARTVAGSPERVTLDAEFGRLEAILAGTGHLAWGAVNPKVRNVDFLRFLDDPDDGSGVWRAPTSMRSVEGEAGARLVQAGAEFPTVAPAAAAAADDEDVF